MIRKSISVVLAILTALCLQLPVAAEEEVLVDIAPTPHVAATADDGVPQYLITFVDAFGQIGFEQILQEGQFVLIPEYVPIRDGFTFMYWYDAAHPEVLPFEFGHATSQDIILWPYFVQEGMEDTVINAPIGEIIREPGVPAFLPGALEDSEIPTVLPGPAPDAEDAPTIAVVSDNVNTTDVDDSPEAVREGLSLSGCAINVFSNHADITTEGETVLLWAELEGFGRQDVSLQWQYMQNPGDAWTDAPGANDLTHSFVATGDSLHYAWRLIAALKDA